MRRSKSNPAKYTRNYKVISQRRMTLSHPDNDDDNRHQKQIKSNMQKILDDAATISDKKEHIIRTKKIRKQQQQKQQQQQQQVPQEPSQIDFNPKDMMDHEDPSKDDEIENDDYAPEEMIFLPPRKKKKKNNNTTMELTEEELRLAKLEHKNLQRKLKQLNSKSIAKTRRSEAYQALSQNALSSHQLELLSSSSTLGKRQSKKQILTNILKKYKAGIKLTKEEEDLLWTTKEVKEMGMEDMEEDDNKGSIPKGTKSNDKMKSGNDTTLSSPKTTKQIKSKSKLRITTKKVEQQVEEEEDDATETGDSDMEKREEDSSTEESESEDEDEKEEEDTNKSSPSTDQIKSDKQEQKESLSSKSKPLSTNSTSTSSGISFAQQMMSGLADLKTKTQIQTNEIKKAAEKAKLEEQEKEQASTTPQTKYIPSIPFELKTVHKQTQPPSSSLSLRSKQKSNLNLPTIERPMDIQELHASNALPIFAMEFEIMDAIQSNSVTIICGETGSGKSTQVPQFLYESGYSTSMSHSAQKNKKDGNNSTPLLIGMTQPRRVAAVSTAKRIAYEMSCGNGQRLTPSKNNVVSYQTRYETAGLGPNTHIKVMTDGILLQEIQSDLLLRKYAVIVLDEAHERNLNTDILLGLLSRSILLRRQVAMEGKRNGNEGLPELKLVIMSATLRVQDFTENKLLFGGQDGAFLPSVVKVPGRTFPVSIHHSKVTELDNYETVALKKVCKIHRKLPDGGILVFMTGKQEIDRFVKRLRQCLSRASSKASPSSSIMKDDDDHDDMNTKILNHNDEGPRDMDDDEIDGDMMLDKNHDDYDEMENDSNLMEILASSSNSSEPLKPAIVLPLHSLLSQTEQAKVFAPVPNNHRLIVIATNIAETSITIPNISYVVDSGRQKCLSHHSSTGVKSYNIMWISKASANQRAGRAGRTGPGHCYRLYSSSLFDRQMDEFAIPEVLVRPLEDIVLTMKNMGIQNVLEFPFVTQPDKKQVISALDLLLSIGCLEKTESGGKTESVITSMGKAVSKVPLGVRYGKMLLIAAKYGILDYAVGLVAVLSETSPFIENFGGTKTESKQKNEKELDDIDRNNMREQEREQKRRKKWLHSGGDVLAAVHALGAYTYAGRGAGGISESIACKTFCEENRLNFVVMQRIQKLRLQLARMCHLRMSDLLDDSELQQNSITMRTGGILYDMAPPNALQETLLRQAIASGSIDNVARLSPNDSMSASATIYNSRLAYQSCNTKIREPLFINSNSTLFSRDFRRLPEWVCYDTLIRKPTKTGGNICTMHNVTPIDPSWLAILSNKKHQLLSLGDVVSVPSPFYDEKKDSVMCYVKTKFGTIRGKFPPLQFHEQAI